jgi:hypothetical protein
MAFADLSPSEQQIVFQCMKAIADSPEIKDWEFHTRLGIVRPTLRRIISMWPAINDGSDSSEEFLAINNCLNEVCHGIKIPDAEWLRWFAHPRDEVIKTYHRWLTLRGCSASGIR